jgi:hypothetical protein
MDQADVDAFLAEMLLIYPVVGLTAFERPSEVASAARELYLRGPDVDARGRELAEGFLVIAGSTGRAQEVPSIHPFLKELRASLA